MTFCMVTEAKSQGTAFSKLPNEHVSLQVDNFKFLSLSISLILLFFLCFLHKQRELLDGNIGMLIYFHIKWIVNENRKIRILQVLTFPEGKFCKETAKFLINYKTASSKLEHYLQYTV